jgi:hypothetical protein
MKKWNKSIQENPKREEMTFDNALDAIKDLRQSKTLSPLIQFTG